MSRTVPIGSQVSGPHGDYIPGTMLSVAELSGRQGVVGIMHVFRQLSCNLLKLLEPDHPTTGITRIVSSTMVRQTIQGRESMRQNSIV